MNINVTSCTGCLESTPSLSTLVGEGTPSCQCGGGEATHLRSGQGDPIPGLDGGRYPILRSGQQGIPFPGPDRGTPFPGPDRGTPFQVQMGYPIPGLDEMGLDRAPHWVIKQHSEHLLHSKQYALCVYAGGLCLKINVTGCTGCLESTLKVWGYLSQV